MALKSQLENHKSEISELLGKGVSIRSAWRIIIYERRIKNQKEISYNAFLHFVNKHIK